MIVGDELLRKRTEDRENEKKGKSLQEMVRVKKL